MLSVCVPKQHRMGGCELGFQGALLHTCALESHHFGILFFLNHFQFHTTLTESQFNGCIVVLTSSLSVQDIPCVFISPFQVPHESHPVHAFCLCPVISGEAVCCLLCPMGTPCAYSILQSMIPSGLVCCPVAS